MLVIISIWGHKPRVFYSKHGTIRGQSFIKLNIYEATIKRSIFHRYRRFGRTKVNGFCVSNITARFRSPAVSVHFFHCVCALLINLCRLCEVYGGVARRLYTKCSHFHTQRCATRDIPISRKDINDIGKTAHTSGSV
jgi:hypothetical protein